MPDISAVFLTIIGSYLNTTYMDVQHVAYKVSIMPAIENFMYFLGLHAFVDKISILCLTTHHTTFILKSVKCYPGRRKIDLISSISEIQSQMRYHCAQYTKRHHMSLTSLF